MAGASSTQTVVSIISYEEQTREWLSYIAKAQTIEQQVEAYHQLKRQLANYCTIPVIEFDELPETSETFIYVAMIRLMLRRLA